MTARLTMFALPGFRFRSLVRKADAARDEGLNEAAATLYREAARLKPSHAGVLIQLGHVLKGCGDFAGAGESYGKARQLRPLDPDLLLQIGHLKKISGEPIAAYRSYREAQRLAPDWDTPAKEILFLEASGIRNFDATGFDPFAYGTERADTQAVGGGGHRPMHEIARLVPSLAPRQRSGTARRRDIIEWRGGGRREAGPWGVRKTFRGVEAIRGFFLSDVEIAEIGIFLNGLLIHRGPLVRFEACEGGPPKYVFNIWLDFSMFLGGLHQFEIRALDHHEKIQSAHDDIVIAAPMAERDYPGSDALIVVSEADPRSIEEQIRARPNQVHQPRRRLFRDGIRNLLVMRPDQLGDLVASIPALQRLRQLLPEARIVGLVTLANADFARTLDMFDEVIAVDFPDDPIERRRLMPLEEQETLRLKLAPYAFDVAIDLAQAEVSRDLLPLADAKFYYGTRGGDRPWLSADFAMHTHDRWTRHDMTPHAAKVLALVETFGAMLSETARVIRRSDLSRDCLSAYGIGPQDRFVVLHAGARIGFSRWPHYRQIAERLLRETDFKVVLMTDGPSDRIAQGDRLIEIDGKVPFDHFDALLSFATVMLGNDSGPKHLAALRGTNVVTLFSARINWTEWGQESGGVIISRKVPCAGCALLHDPEECGKAFACVADIEPEGVYREMSRYFDGDATPVAE